MGAPSCKVGRCKGGAQGAQGVLRRDGRSDAASNFCAVDSHRDAAGNPRQASLSACWQWVDPRLLRIALENLLRNAWKFTHKKPGAVIELGKRSEPGRTVDLVADNRAG